eukprot:SAG22_NODE_19286_length_276_cov_0.717514_1_plen_61_part_01
MSRSQQADAEPASGLALGAWGRRISGTRGAAELPPTRRSASGGPHDAVAAASAQPEPEHAT